MRMTGIAKAEAIRLALGVGVLGVTVTGLSTVATGAFFTNSTHTAPRIVAGTVSLTVTPTSTPATTGFTITGMAPGDVQYRAITVKNSGSLAARYSLATTVTHTPNVVNLADALNLAVAVVPSNGVCADTAFAAPGATLVGDVAPAALAFGSSVQGADPGDRDLDAQKSETLCFRATLPKETTDVYQGKTATMSFVFSSEQTANNP